MMSAAACRWNIWW